ncbi:hypothetical protein EYZ11_007605 [Aspergillus tanneri]|uniref:Beta-glucosidase 1B n=1 Tax=Aspergillus tanneri TaxID=1220188 RepID=A0A4S3JCJ5_9EURO|nr:hypothetical protein EYZ11_007605 [Aspergillus tanneri]
MDPTTTSTLPSDFLWGFATASYQIEGAVEEDGRGPSIWDTFCKIPGKIAGGVTGDVACDSYHRTHEDIALLKECALLGLGLSLSYRDLPDELEKRYGGLPNKDEFVADFAHYARIPPKAFGPKVKHWITFNESWCSSVLGYNFKATDGGEIGITLNGDWAEPWDPENPTDVEACDRKIEFAISWFAEPIYHGKYPDSMVKQLGDRLPKWTPEDIALVHRSNDFYGMNHYCANFIKAKTGEPDPNDTAGNLEILLQNKNGAFIGPETQSPWLRPSAIGFRKLLKWLSDRYSHPKIYVTENGTSLKGENDLPLGQLLKDEFRTKYFRDYIGAMADAYTLDGVNVRAYMGWSLME